MGDTNIKFICKDGTVLRPGDSLYLPYNKDTEQIYEFILNHKIIKRKTVKK